MRKKDSKSSLLLLSVFLYLFIYGCKTGGNFVIEPFADYKSDAFFFREVGQGNDMDLQKAKSKALHNAKVEIARNAHSVCQMIVLDYLNQTEENKNISLKDQFITVSIESVSESLVNVVVEDVVIKKNNNNSYTCYTLVKVQRNNVFETLENHLQNKRNINTELFKQVLDNVANQINTK